MSKYTKKYKKCSYCKKYKLLQTNFYKLPSHTSYRVVIDGYRSHCNFCHKKISSKYYYKKVFKGDKRLCKKLDIKKNDLYNYYRVQKLGVSVIAKKYSTSRTTIHNWLKRYKIKVFGLSESKKINPLRLCGDKSPTKKLEVRRKMSLNHADFSGKNNPMYNDHRFEGKNNPNWHGGISDKGYPWYWNRRLKERIKIVIIIPVKNVVVKII